MRGVLLLVACLLLGLAGVDGLYFHMKENQQKCFLEEVPKDTHIVGKYRLQLANDDQETFNDASDETGVHVIVKVGISCGMCFGLDRN